MLAGLARSLAKIAMKQESKAIRKAKRMAEGRFKMAKSDPLKFLGDRYFADITTSTLNPVVRFKNKGKSLEALVRTGNLKELTKYVHELQEFNKNTKMFFRGQKGAPISSDTLREAIKVTKEYNEFIREQKAAVADILTPWLGDNMTAGEWHALMDVPGAMDQDTFFNLQERNEKIRPTRWFSEEGAQRWIEALKESMSPDAQVRRLGEAKTQAAQMLDVIGDESLRKRIEQLSDDQFWFLWTNDETLANALSYSYEKNSYDQNRPVRSPSYNHALSEIADQYTERLEGVLSNLGDLNVPEGYAKKSPKKYAKKKTSKSKNKGKSKTPKQRPVK